jgi:putative transposase
LEGYAKGTHTALHLKQRSKIVLLAADGISNNNIEKEAESTAKTVKRWRDRYSNQYEELKRIEEETPHKLRSTIEDILSDEQRAGRKPEFTDGQVASIIALACMNPADLELPFSHWTPSLLREEAIKQNIVESISVRQIGRFLKRNEI